MIPYKGRECPVGLKIAVYRNLHKATYSIKALEGPDKGKVVAHAKTVYLAGVTFHVSQAGRERVLAERRKNVHATLQGRRATALEVLTSGDPDTLQEVYYNPYKTRTFECRDTGMPAQAAQYAYCNEKFSLYVWGGDEMPTV